MWQHIYHNIFIIIYTPLPDAFNKFSFNFSFPETSTKLAILVVQNYRFVIDKDMNRRVNGKVQCLVLIPLQSGIIVIKIGHTGRKLKKKHLAE